MAGFRSIGLHSRNQRNWGMRIIATRWKDPRHAEKRQARNKNSNHGIPPFTLFRSYYCNPLTTAIRGSAGVDGLEIKPRPAVEAAMPRLTAKLRRAILIFEAHAQQSSASWWTAIIHRGEKLTNERDGGRPPA